MQPQRVGSRWCRGCPTLPQHQFATSRPAQGVMDLLMSDAPVARQLRASFTFLLVPMLNPDGVAAGNTRGSLAGGQDLNRIWDCPSRLLHPEVGLLAAGM
jgi:hypothetical protein